MSRRPAHRGGRLVFFSLSHLHDHNTKLPFQGALLVAELGDGEPKASLTEYLQKNKEKLVLLRFDFAEITAEST